VIPGETVATGAQVKPCEFCGDVPVLGVYQSVAGHYIGYGCCLPYSRESAYYRTREAAESALERRDYGR
jgi:hypothetical protein